MEGFVFVQAEHRCVQQVARRISDIDGILSVEAVTGPYDLVARARRDCEEGLVRCLEEDIESVPGVIRALVCPLESHARIWEMGARPAFVGSGV